MNTSDTSSDTSNSPQDQQFTPGYRRYVLFVLMMVYALNFVDRQILVILQESIKADMALSDTQLGLLTGFAFAIFYVSVGIPIARWADVGNRKNIISLAIAVWSGMTALSGLTQNFWQLLLARIGVGVGEAGGSPPAHSIISDYYPAEQRGTAISIYSIGLYLGILLGFIVGGWVNQQYGWRVAFFVVGLPGFLVALVVKLTIIEPIRGRNDGKIKHQVEKGSFRQSIATLFKLKSFGFYAVGASLVAFVQYGVGNFLPSFLIRTHQLGYMEVGVTLAVITGIGGAIGTFCGGYMADKFGVKDKRWYLWAAAFPALLSLPFILIALSSSDLNTARICLFLGTLFLSFYFAPIVAITHSLVLPQMRAMGSAVLFFIINLIGLGLGPLFVGVASDLLNPAYGQDSLRYALMLTSLVSVIAAVLILMGSRRLLLDLRQ